MPIEIRELHIRVSIHDSGGSAASASSGSTGATNTTSGGTASDPSEELVERCVEKVLEIIRNKNER